LIHCTSLFSLLLISYEKDIPVLDRELVDKPCKVVDKFKNWSIKHKNWSIYSPEQVKKHSTNGKNLNKFMVK
jgi:hypothetical protein